MIILGGESPVIETPEPKFGAVIKKMDDLVAAIQAATDASNTDDPNQIASITTQVSAFSATVPVAIKNHVNAIGPQHGETKATVGLSKKDNYRTATLAEQTALSPVNAFVTPQGASAAILANKGSFSLTNYQNNDLIPFSSFFFPNQFPTVTPSTVDPARYFGADKKTGLLLNGDRLVFSPYSDVTQYAYQSIFTSLPTGGSKASRLGEIPNLNARYLTASWNTQGCDDSNGLTAFFKPLADKKIYQFNNNLALPGTNTSYLLYSTFANLPYKGLAISSSSAGTVVTLNHKFFYDANPTTAPVLVELISHSYLGGFTRFDTPPYQAPANGSQSFDIASYVNLPVGATLLIGGGSHGIVTSLMWNVQNTEIYLHVAVPVIIQLGGFSRNLVFSFMMSIIPGSLIASGGATFTQLGTFAKDTLGSNLLPINTPNWFNDGNVYDLFNLTQYPGVMLNSGVLIKTAATKNGLRVKRLNTTYTSAKQWLSGARPTVDARLAATELYCPARHACFGLMPERIIPISHDSGGTSYLVYGVDEITGLFGWKEYDWTSASIVSTQTPNNTFGVRLPTKVTLNNNLEAIPGGLSVIVDKDNNGVTVSSLVFNEANGYVGHSSIRYLNGVLTLGGGVSLAISTLVILKTTSGQMLVRAALTNPLVDPKVRKASIQVFKLTESRMVVLFTDGVSYAEVGVAGFSVVNNVCTLSYTTSAGLQLFQATASGQPATVGKRESASGDGTWLNYADMLTARVNHTTFNIVFTRPFGNVYGDLSVTLQNPLAPVQIVTLGEINPARLYQGVDAFDTVTEIYPALLIPNKGVYQHNPANTQFITQMNEVGGITNMDPFNINETGWVRLPAGARFVINGRTILIDKDYAVNVGVTGTWYCYMQYLGGVLTAIASSVIREPVNSEILFGVATNGLLTLQKNYITIGPHVVSATRTGNAIPYFADDGGQGVNQFFTKEDYS